MGLFNKKDKKEVKGGEIPRLPDLPQLPELPRLPEFTDTDEYSNEKLAKLPGLSNNFSQSNFKNAVTGRKEVEEDADDFAIRSEMQMMQNPLIKEESFGSTQEKPRVKEAEPLFIRIDKFEEGSRAFEAVKKQIMGVERLFNDLKRVKENEEKEIRLFESEIKQIKDKLEGIDKNIFSKVG